MTEWINVKKDEWTKVADGPCTLQKDKQIPLKVYIGNELPLSPPFGIWEDRDFQYGGDEDIYVKSDYDVRITIFS